MAQGASCSAPAAAAAQVGQGGPSQLTIYKDSLLLRWIPPHGDISGIHTLGVTLSLPFRKGQQNEGGEEDHCEWNLSKHESKTYSCGLRGSGVSYLQKTSQTILK